MHQHRCRFTVFIVPNLGRPTYADTGTPLLFLFSFFGGEVVLVCLPTCPCSLLTLFYSSLPRQGVRNACQNSSKRWKANGVHHRHTYRHPKAPPSLFSPWCMSSLPISCVLVTLSFFIIIIYFLLLEHQREKIFLKNYEKGRSQSLACCWQFSWDDFYLFAREFSLSLL